MKENYEATIKQKDATIELLQQKTLPNLSQWDSGFLECEHKEEKLVKLNVPFTSPPAIITNLGSDAGDPIGIIISNVNLESFTIKALGPPMRPFSTGHIKKVTINWVALSK